MIPGMSAGQPLQQGSRSGVPGGPKRPGRLYRLLKALLLIGTLGLAFFTGAWIMLRVTVRQTPQTTVPRVIGQELSAAEVALRAAGLAPEVSARRFDPSAAAGIVLAQIPDAGSATRPGRPVRLVISLGARRATVPDLAGSSQERVQFALRTAGLLPGTMLEIPDSSVAKGRVLGQHPPAQSDAAPGDRVALLISAGPPPVRFVMPDLIGQRIDSASSWLTNRGFKQLRLVGPTGEASPREKIRQQDPRAGYSVTREDLITLTTGGE